MNEETGVGTYEGRSYSGHGEGLYNGAMENKPNEGPIPTGEYDIGPLETNTTQKGTELKNSMRLTPDPGVAPGRGGFIWHGEDVSSYNFLGASTGCPVSPLDVRRAVGNSGDNRLEVIP